MARLCRVFAVVVCLLGFVFGISSCRAMAIQNVEIWPGVFTALFYWFFAFLGGFVFIVLAQVLERLDMVESIVSDNQHAMEDLRDELAAVRRIANGEEPQSTSAQPVFRRIALRQGTWQCKKCHTNNPSTEISCKECGTYR